MSAHSEFERAALPHLDAAYNLAHWIVRHPADAEDIVQDAYLRAFKAYGQFSGTDIRPWLLTIVRNVAYRWLTVRKRGQNVISLEDALSGRHDAMPELASSDPSAEDLLIGQAERDRVEAALAALPPAYREVVVLRDLEGLSYRDIATVMAIPIGTVMSRLARARDQLRQHLALAKEDKNAL